VSSCQLLGGQETRKNHEVSQKPRFRNRLFGKKNSRPIESRKVSKTRDFGNRIRGISKRGISEKIASGISSKIKNSIKNKTILECFCSSGFS
jgi:hypothetical protein